MSNRIIIGSILFYHNCLFSLTFPVNTNIVLYFLNFSGPEPGRRSHYGQTQLFFVNIKKPIFVNLDQILYYWVFPLDSDDDDDYDDEDDDDDDDDEDEETSEEGTEDEESNEDEDNDKEKKGEHKDVDTKEEKGKAS